MTFRPARRDKISAGGVTNAIAHRFPMKFTLGLFYLAIVEKAILLYEQPGVEPRVFAFGGDFLTLQVGDSVDSGIRAHDQPVV